jgi:uncharacterized protein (DUF2164 family)
MAKTYKRTQRRTKYKTRTRKRTRRRRKQKRGGAPTQTTNVPSILLGPYRHSGEECIKKMVKAMPPNELTLERLREYPALLNTYTMLLLITPNSNTYSSQMKPGVKEFIDDINKRRLLEYQEQHSTGEPKKMPPSIKGDLRLLNAAYVAEILSPAVNKNATIQEIIDWLTGPAQPTTTQPTTPSTQPTATQSTQTTQTTQTTKEKVLVLCQRKLDENGEELVNRDIDNLLDALNIGAERDIKYASPMDENHVGKVDFEGEFGKNDFTKNNFTKGDYSVIILNTCPFRFMKYGIISEYLKPNGRIVLSKFDKRTLTNFVEQQADGNGFYQRRLGDAKGDAKDKLSDAGFELEKTYKDALVFRRK